jgi:hypothetical protein
MVCFRCIGGNTLNEDGDDDDDDDDDNNNNNNNNKLVASTYFLPANIRFSALPIPYVGLTIHTICHTQNDIKSHAFLNSTLNRD